MAIAVMDKEYPTRAAFSVLGKMSDDYVNRFEDSWKTVSGDDPRVTGARGGHRVVPGPSRGG